MCFAIKIKCFPRALTPWQHLRLKGTIKSNPISLLCKVNRTDLRYDFTIHPLQSTHWLTSCVTGDTISQLEFMLLKHFQNDDEIKWNFLQFVSSFLGNFVNFCQQLIKKKWFNSLAWHPNVSKCFIISKCSKTAHVEHFLQGYWSHAWMRETYSLTTKVQYVLDIQSASFQLYFSYLYFKSPLFPPPTDSTTLNVYSCFNKRKVVGSNS